MSVWIIMGALFAVFIVFAVIHKIDKFKKPARMALISMLTGLLTLILVNVTGYFTGIHLPISLLSVSASVVGGIPGVTAMLALNLFF